MRRYTAYMSGERYLGDSTTKLAHDLEKEKAGCKIDEIIRAGKELPFHSLKDANDEGYANCNFCLNNSNKIHKIFKPGSFKTKLA